MGAPLSRAHKLVTYTPLKFEHTDLEEAGEALRDLHEQSQKGWACLIEDWIECLKDRQDYDNHLLDLIRLVWQSLCTTVLARRVRIEEDLDDGTFTTVHRGQLEGEFKRLGMVDLETQEDSCRRMCEILKSRIRDLKRIFAFYAASGDGGYPVLSRQCVLYDLSGAILQSQVPRRTWTMLSSGGL